VDSAEQETKSERPFIEGSPYIRWSPSTGFGVHLGCTTQAVLRNHEAAGREILANQAVLGTYGGLVTTFEEAANKLYCLTLPGLSKLFQFPFRESQKKEAATPVVDATAIYAGDGGFVNNSCCPTLTTFHMITSYSSGCPNISGVDTRRSERLRNIAQTVRFHPARYDEQFANCTCYS